MATINIRQKLSPSNYSVIANPMAIEYLVRAPASVYNIYALKLPANVPGAFINVLIKLNDKIIKWICKIFSTNISLSYRVGVCYSLVLK